MTDISEFEIDEEELEEIAKDMSIYSGFELSAIRTVLPSTALNGRVKYSEVSPCNEMTENDGMAQRANKYGFFDIPEPLPKKYNTH